MISNNCGEGFGLPARDAMGTGMPTIITGGFLPYEHFANNELIIESTLVDSPWPDVHPGKMWQPEFDDLVDILRLTADDYEFEAYEAYNTAPKIHEYYNWENLTQRAFSDLEYRLR
jgi:glycosyltransferase involved in cell wall biosynthesis